MKPYELTVWEKDDIWADGKRIDAFISYDTQIAHAAQRKLLEYQESKRLLQHECAMLASTCAKSCESCQLLKDFGIGEGNDKEKR